MGINDFPTSIRNLLNFVDELLVNFHKIGSYFGHLSEKQHLFEKQLSIINK